MKNIEKKAFHQEDLISILLAAYNTEKYIAECIDSILAQTYKNLEIIIIDDGSTDATGKIIDIYERKDKRIKVWHTENCGCGNARNIGNEKATGTYVFMADSDDYLLPDMITKMHDEIIRSNSDICICDYYTDVKNIELAEINQNTESAIIMRKSEFMPLILMDKIQSMTWNKLIKRELLDNIYFSKGVAQDLGVMHKIFYNARQISLLTEKLYFYRDSSENNPVNTTNSAAIKFESSYYRGLHFMERFQFSKKYYPECERYLLDRAVGLYCAAYMKAFYKNSHEKERKEIRKTLLNLIKETKQVGNISVKNRIMAEIIINNLPVIRITSGLYMFVRYRI